MPKGMGYGGKMTGGKMMSRNSVMQGTPSGGMMPGKSSRMGMKSHDGMKGGVFDVRDKGMKSSKGNSRTYQAADRYK